MLLGVLLEQVASRPLHREEVKAIGEPNLESADDVGVCNALSELCLARETCNRGLLPAEFLAEYLEGHDTMHRMFRAVNYRSTALSNERLQRISSDCPTDEALVWHGANLMSF
jgi:hypothetical protein